MLKNRCGLWVHSEATIIRFFKEMKEMFCKKRLNCELKTVKCG